MYICLCKQQLYCLIFYVLLNNKQPPNEDTIFWCFFLYLHLHKENLNDMFWQEKWKKKQTNNDVCSLQITT